MGSRARSGIGSSKRGAPLQLQLVWACLALLLILHRCSPCEGRKLLPAEEQGKVMHFEGGLVLRVLPSPGGGSDGSGEEAAVTPRGFSVSGRAARLMRSVPSPGVGH